MVIEFLRWFFIIVVGVIGIFIIYIIYIIGRLVFGYLAPELDEKIELHFISKDINRYFGFLFEKGYKILDAKYSNGSWYVQLGSQDYEISVVHDRSEILMSFVPERTDRRNQVSLGAMIYYLTQEKVFIGYFDGDLAWEKNKQFKRLASLLGQYHDQIAAYIRNDFVKSKDELSTAQKKYNNLLFQEYDRKYKAKQQFH